MRLIDADAFDTKLFNDGFLGGLAACIGNTPRKRKFTIGEFRGMLAKAPTIDAVPVVRCKDCVNYKSNPYSKHFDVPEMMCMCWIDWIPTEPDDFCSCGERKGE